MNGVERNIHADEEERPLEILDSSYSIVCLPEKENRKESCEGGSDNLYIGSLGQADQVHEVTCSK